MNLGARIRSIRLSKGLTQAEVSSETGLAVPYLSRIENDHIEPSITTIHKIARALRVELVDFFGDRSVAGDLPRMRGAYGPDRDSAGVEPEKYSARQLKLLRLSKRLILHGDRKVYDALEMLLSSLSNHRGIRA